jgi:hypothetical protein
MVLNSALVIDFVKAKRSATDRFDEVLKFGHGPTNKILIKDLMVSLDIINL